MKKIQFFDDAGIQRSPETWAESVYVDEAGKTLKEYLRKMDSTIASFSSSYIAETEEEGVYICDNEGRYIFSCSDVIDALGFGKVLKSTVDAIAKKTEENIEQQINALSAVTFREAQKGTIHLFGDDQPLYQLHAELFPLSLIAGEKDLFKLSNNPIGCNSYISVIRFSVTDGVGGVSTTLLTPNYKVSRLFTGKDLCTYVEVECIENVSAYSAKAIIGLEYVCEIGEKLRVELTFPSVADLSKITIRKPWLKYDKKCAFLYLTDDAFSSAYNNFAYCSGRPYQNEGAYTHYGQENVPNANNTIRYYTDGCGTKIPFRFEVALWPWNDLSNSEEGGAYNPQVTYKDTPYFCDFGNMICCHDVYYNHDNPEDFDLEHSGSWSTDKIPIQTDGTKEDIAIGMHWTPLWLYAKTGIFPKTCIEPAGNEEYGRAFKLQNTIKAYVQKKNGRKFINFAREDMALYNMKDMDVFNRDFAGTNPNQDDITKLVPYLQSIADSVNNNDKVIPARGEHNHRNAFFSDLDTLCQSLGGEGSDILWFTGVTEIYEYSYLRNRSVIKTSVKDNVLIIECLMPPTEHFYYKDFSLVLEGLTTTPVSSVISNNIVCERHAVNDTGLMININYNPLCVKRVEKYVSAYERARKVQDRFDAIALMNLLSDELQATFMERIQAIDSTLNPY